MKLCLFVAFSLPFRCLFVALSLGLATPALSDWKKTLDAARGQTVYWNAWGGDERTNAFIAWVGERTEALCGVRVTQVKLTYTAEAVTRVISKKAAGQDDVPVDGMESPWRLSKFVFTYDSARVEEKVARHGRIRELGGGQSGAVHPSGSVGFHGG